MPFKRALLILAVFLNLAIGVLTGIFPLLAEEKSPKPSWLDKLLTNWNQPGVPIPKPSLETVDSNELTRCKERVRPPSDAADQSLNQAGWTLFGPVQKKGNAAFILAMSGADGQCRPLGFQGFVFVDGKFAGVVSPFAMDARTDSALDLNKIRLKDATDLEIEFLRYSDVDPFCCPSRTQVVTYKIVNGLLTPAKANAPQAHPEALLISLLKAKLGTKGSKLWIEPAYVSIKQDWAYLIGSLSVLVDGEWENVNDGGLAALYRRVRGRWVILEWARYGPDEKQTELYEERVRKRQKTDELPEGLLPKSSLVWGE